MRDHCSVPVAAAGAAVVVVTEDNAMRWLDRCSIEVSIIPNLHWMSDRKIVFCLDRRLKSTVAVLQLIVFAANDTTAVADESTISMSQELSHWIRNAMQFLRCQPVFHSMNWNARLNVTFAAEN